MVSLRFWYPYLARCPSPSLPVFLQGIARSIEQHLHTLVLPSFSKVVHLFTQTTLIFHGTSWRSLSSAIVSFCTSNENVNFCTRVFAGQKKLFNHSRVSVVSLLTDWQNHNKSPLQSSGFLLQAKKTLYTHISKAVKWELIPQSLLCFFIGTQISSLSECA